MTVVISNLLVGLTVSVVAQLLEHAKMDGMEFKLEQIIGMDSSLLMKTDFLPWNMKSGDTYQGQRQSRSRLALELLWDPMITIATNKKGMF